MGRLFVGNFDFEHRLAATTVGRRDAVRRVSEDLGFVWSTIACADDVLLTPVMPDREFLPQLAANGCAELHLTRSVDDVDRSLDVCPWGWDVEVDAWCRRHGFAADVPDLSTVRAINAREFSATLETQHGEILPGSFSVGSWPVQTLTDLSPLLDASRQASGEWVIKTQWSMAGREVLRGQAAALNSQQQSWVETRLARDGMVFFEPWMEKLAEVSWQFDVPHAQAGPPHLLGATQLITNARGAHVGNRVLRHEHWMEWRDVLAVATDTAQLAQDRGYRGPLGIDSMKYRDPTGRPAYRALQDINARWTMGRLALGLDRLAEPEADVSWWHIRWAVSQSSRDWWQRLLANCGASVRVVRTSPFEVDGRPVELGTLAVISTDLEAMRYVENRMLTSPNVGRTR